MSKPALPPDYIWPGVSLALDGWHLCRAPQVTLIKSELRPVENRHYNGPVYAVQTSPREIEVVLRLRENEMP